MKYLFEKPLIRGVIESRPNRFIMFVRVKGQLVKCHCPSTGSIGGIKFSNTPCLLSEGKGDRKTKYTVEAISLDKGKNWIGINQTKANAYVEFFLKSGMLKKMCRDTSFVKREVVLGNSRIDFLVGKDYLEVKTPLRDLKIEGQHLSGELPVDFQRLVKHFGDLSTQLKKGSRAIVLLCFIYGAPRFSPPVPKGGENKIIKAARKASRAGLENWQINLNIDRKGVELRDYFKLKLF